MAKFRMSAAAAGLALSAAFATQAFAITNEAECGLEGGSMVNVKGSDYCLVPIRDEAYADPIYDGNQLGVIECPGSELNDGDYCLYPVTIRPEVSTPAAVVSETVTETDAGSTIVDTVVDEVVDTATDAATDAAEGAVEDAVTDIVQ